MRIHIQNPTDGDMPSFTPAEWEAAVTRNGAIAQGHQVSFGEGRAAFEDAIGEAEALIAIGSTIKACFPAKAPKLRLIFISAAGLDFLAPFDWLPPGCALLNNRGTHEAKGGEFAIMAVLMLANRIPVFVTQQRAGTWRKHWGHVLAGQHLAVIGLGTLGAAAARHAKHFGMRVTGIRTSAGAHPDCDAVVADTALDDVLPTADFVLLACPLTDRTRNILDAHRIALLPSHAGVVNIGRGGLLDQDALCDALEAGRIGGAVLDVFDPEPIPPGHRLWAAPNLIISPHTSADDRRTYNPRSLDIFFDNLRADTESRDLPNRFHIARGY